MNTRPSSAERGIATDGATLDAASRLALVARQLNGSCTVDDIVDTVLRQGMALLHADGAVFAVEHGDHLLPRAVLGASVEVFANIGLLPLVSALPIAQAARTGATIWLRDASATETEFPLLRHIAPDVQAWAALPVELEGDRVGVFGFCFLRPQPFDEIHRLYVRALTDMSARPLRAALAEGPVADRLTTASIADEIAGLVDPLQTASQLACALLADGMLGSHATGVSIAARVTPDELVLIATAGYLGDVLSRRTLRLRLDDPSPMTRAIDERCVVPMHDRAAVAERSPSFATIAPAAEAAITIPAIHDGRVVGTIGVTYDAPQAFGAEHLAELETLAATIGRHFLAPLVR